MASPLIAGVPSPLLPTLFSSPPSPSRTMSSPTGHWSISFATLRDRDDGKRSSGFLVFEELVGPSK
jgi:hypothetical protein